MAKARVEITATNAMQKGLNSSKKSLSEFQKYTEQLNQKIKSALSLAAIATAAVASIKKITSATKECIEAFSVAEKVSKRLQAVWSNVGSATGKSAKQIEDYAEAVEKTTYFTGEAVKESALLLAATEQLTEEGFQRALDASADLAAALGEDITGAAQLLAKALEDPSAALNRLKTIGVTFTEEEKKQIKELTAANKLYDAQAIILDKVEQKYKGVAQAINDTPVGTLNNIKDVFTDIKENLGEGLLNAISPVLEDIYGWLTKISDWVYTWKNDGVTREQQALKDRANAAIGIWEKGSISSVADYKTVMSGWDVLNMALKDSAERGDVTGNVATQQVMNDLNKMLDDWFGDLSYWMSSAFTHGGIFSEEMAQKVRDGLEVFTDMDDEWRVFLEKALNQWDTELSPSAIAKAQQGLKDYITSNTSLSKTKQIDDVLAKISEAWTYRTKAENLGMTELLPYIDDIIESLGEQLKSLKGIEDPVKDTRTFLQKISDNVGEKVATVFGVDSEQGKAFAGNVLSNVTSSLGETGEVMSELAQNMATMGPLLGAIATALKYVLEGFGEVLRPMLDEFLKYGLEPLREIGRVIANLIKPLLEELMPLVRDSAESFMQVINEIGAALAPIIRIIASVISPILNQIGNTLKMIEPILNVVCKAIAWVAGTFAYVNDVFQHIAAVILNWIAGFHIGNWKPFEGIKVQDKGMPGDYDAYIKNYMNGIDTAGASVDVSNSAQTAVSSASYRGATSVTINIYQEGPVVGDGGMRQFAEMIREEFDALNYYGVSA